MSKSKLHIIWWLCMLPSFAAMALFSYEWYQNQSENKFLIYAIICLLAGVVFGSLIVGASAGTEKEHDPEPLFTAEPELTGFDGMEPPPPKGTPEENWTGATVVQDAWWERSHPSFEEVQADIQPEVLDPSIGADGVVVRTGSEQPEKMTVAAPKAEALKAGSSEDETAKAERPKAREEKVELEKEPESEEITLAREFLAPISDRPEPVKSDSAGLADMFQSFDATPGKSGDVFGAAETMPLEPAQKAKESEEEKAAKILAAHRPKVETTAAAAPAATNDGDKVEKAQQVVARLEAEVAKAEAVAKKLENELAKAEPMAARLEEQKKATPVQNTNTQSKDTGSNKKAAPAQNTSKPAAASPSKSTGQQSKAKESSLPLPDLKNIEEWFTHAEKMIAEKNYDDAIKCYDKINKTDAKNFDGWYLKGLAIRKKGKHEDAVYCFNYAIGINDKSPQAHAEKGECLLLSGKTDQALIAFDKSLSLDKVAPKPWLGKARCFAAMGKHKDAVACFDKVLAMEPENEEAKKEKKTSVEKMSAKK